MRRKCCQRKWEKRIVRATAHASRTTNVTLRPSWVHTRSNTVSMPRERRVICRPGTLTRMLQGVALGRRRKSNSPLISESTASPATKLYTDEQYMQRIAEQVQKLVTAKEIKDDSPKDNLLSEKAVRLGGRNQDGSGPTKSEDFFSVSGFRTHVVATAVCATGGVYTHSVSHAHFSDIFFAWRTDIAHTHGSRWLQCACHISPCHISPFSCSIRRPCCSLLGHFETTFPTLTSAPSLPNCSRSESAGLAHFLWIL